MNRLKSATAPRHSRMGIAIAAALGLLSSSAVLAQQTATPAAPAAEQAAPTDETVELDTVLVIANKRVEKQATVANKNAQIANEKMDAIHGLVNSDKTKSMMREYALLLEIAELKKTSGQPLLPSTLEHIEAVRAEIIRRNEYDASIVAAAAGAAADAATKPSS